MYLEERVTQLTNGEQEIKIKSIFVHKSISLLLVKILLLHLLVIGALFFMYLPFFYMNSVPVSITEFVSIMFFTFLLLIFAHMFLTLFLIVQWTHESYEIRPTEIIHRQGLLFKKVEHFTFMHLMSVEMKQGLWGQILNFGTIHMYDRYINADVYMFQIHNPKRYQLILSQLIPFVDEKEECLQNPLYDEEGEEVERVLPRRLLAVR